MKMSLTLTKVNPAACLPSTMRPKNSVCDTNAKINQMDIVAVRAV